MQRFECKNRFGFSATDFKVGFSGPKTLRAFRETGPMFERHSSDVKIFSPVENVTFTVVTFEYCVIFLKRGSFPGADITFQIWKHGPSPEGRPSCLASARRSKLQSVKYLTNPRVYLVISSFNET